MRTALLLLFAAAALSAQNFTLSTGGTLIASGGDGTSCTVSKTPGSVVSFTATCTPGIGGPLAAITLTMPAGKSGATTFQVGDITCIVAMNATAGAVTLGSSGSVAPSSAILSCAVNIRSTPSGPVTATSLVPPQTLTWP